MELHELEIRDAGAGLERHRHPVARRDGRIGGLAEDVAGAARRQQRPHGAGGGDHTVAVHVGRAHAHAAFDVHRHRQRVVEDADSRVAGDAPPQHASNFAPGGVARMQHPADAVRGLASQRRLPVGIAVEIGTPRQQFVDVAGPVGHQHPHRVRIAQAVAGGDGVARVQVRRVVRPHRRRHTALGITGVALTGVGLGQNGHLAGLRQRQCGPQAGHAAADDEEVGAQVHDAILSTGRRTPQSATGVHPAGAAPTPFMTTPLSAPARIDVTTGSQSSTIWVGHGIVDELGARLDRHGAGGKRFIVSSPRIWKHHGARIQAALGHAHGGPVEPILIPDGERYKTLASVSRVYDALIRGGADRGSTLVAVGGGVVGDAAGFAAASFLRGIRLAQVPTTLLAQVDSSIGGKVGVNHPLGKNLIGAFHQPAVVVADPGLLRTLPKREFRSGLYEVVKYGVIWSHNLFEHLRTQRKAIVAHGPGRAAAGHRGVGRHQSEGGIEGRTRRWPPADPELRPHDRARARSRHQLPAVSARRGHCVRHARGRRHQRAARRAARGRPDGTRRSDRGPRVRCRPCRICQRRRCSKPCGATRRS